MLLLADGMYWHPLQYLFIQLITIGVTILPHIGARKEYNSRKDGAK